MSDYLDEDAEREFEQWLRQVSDNMNEALASQIDTEKALALLKENCTLRRATDELPVIDHD